MRTYRCPSAMAGVGKLSSPKSLTCSSSHRAGFHHAQLSSLTHEVDASAHGNRRRVVGVEGAGQATLFQDGAGLRIHRRQDAAVFDQVHHAVVKQRRRDVRQVLLHAPDDGLRLGQVAAFAVVDGEQRVAGCSAGDVEFPVASVDKTVVVEIEVAEATAHALVKLFGGDLAVVVFVVFRERLFERFGDGRGFVISRRLPTNARRSYCRR